LGYNKTEANLQKKIINSYKKLQPDVYSQKLWEHSGFWNLLFYLEQFQRYFVWKKCHFLGHPVWFVSLSFRSDLLLSDLFFCKIELNVYLLQKTSLL